MALQGEVDLSPKRDIPEVNLEDQSLGIGPVDQLLANSRATKAHQGLQAVLPNTYEDYRTAIVNGQEGQIRQQSASQLDAVNSSAASDNISQAIGMKTGPLTQQDYQLFQSMASPTPTDPKMVFEKSYATAFMGQMDDVAAREDTPLTGAQNNFPNATRATQQFGADIIAKRERALTEMQDIAHQLSQQSWGGWTADYLKTWVPFYSEFKLRGQVPYEGLLPLGSALNEQAINLMQLSPDEFNQKFSEIMQSLRSSNPQIAMQFAQAVVGMSTSDIALGNLDTTFQMAALPDIATLGKVITRPFLRAAIGPLTREDVTTAVRDIATKPLPDTAKETVVNTVSDMVKASAAGETPGVPVQVVKANAVGDAREAAVQTVSRRIDAVANGSDNPVRDAFQALPSYSRIDADNIEKEANKYGRELTNRLLDPYNKFIEKVVGVLSDTLKVNRIPELTQVLKDPVDARVRLMEQIMKDDLPGTLGNDVLDVNVRPNELGMGLVGDIDLGRSGRQLFFSKQEATNYAKSRGIADAQFVPERQGVGWFIRFTRPFDENKSVIKDLFVQSKNDKLPDGLASWFNAALGGLQSPTRTMSQASNLNRVAATFAPSKLLELAQEQLGEIQKLASWTIPGTSRKQKWLDWQRVMEGARSMRDENGLTGRSLRTASDVDDAYERIHGRLADDQEIAATMAFNRFNELDRIIRNVRVYTNKGRLGVLTHMLKLANQADITGTSPAFDGVLRKALPRGQGDTIMVMGDKLGDEELKNTGNLNQRTYKMYSDAIHRGEKSLIEVYDPDARPFNEWSKVANDKNARVRYILVDTKQVASKMIDWDQLPRRGAGHFDYAHPFYMKQARIHFERTGDEITATPRVESGMRRLYRGIDEEEGKFYSTLKSAKDADAGFIHHVDVSKEDLAEHFTKTGDNIFNTANEEIKGQAKPFIARGSKAKIRAIYTGDSTVMPFQLRAIGEDMLKHFNVAREFIRTGDMDAAKNYVKTHLPVEWQEFKGWFEDKMINGVKQYARLSKDEPFHIVPKDRQIMDVHDYLEKKYKGMLEDGTRSGSLARQHSVQFTGERDAYELHTINDKGTQHNPIYNYEPARLVDLIPTMNRAMTRISHSLFMDDYKIFAVNHWLEEAAPYLKKDVADIRRSTPFSTFMNITDNSFKKSAEFTEAGITKGEEMVRNLKTARYNIQQFVGQPNKLAPFLDRMSQVLSDSLYRKFGPKSIDAFWNPAWMIPKIRDPIRFMKQMVTHSRLGLFSIPQLFVQGSTFLDTISTAGLRYAVPSVHAASLHLWASMAHPDILPFLDRLASNMRMPGSSYWKPGEWLEARENLYKTGFNHVGHEHALIDSPFANNVVRKGASWFLDAGLAFFKGGERFARTGAWYTAFKEFRDAKPTAVIDNNTLQQITQRAHTLSMNMARDANSRLQQGVLSLPSQFYTYTLRKVENFMPGSQLSWADRRRLLINNAILYGIPSATGLVTAGLPTPFVGNLRKFAQENGYVVGDNFLMDLGMNGAPAMLTALITGSGDTRAGFVPNIGERYGSTKFDSIDDAFRGDKTLMDLLGGASWSLLTGAYSSSSGFLAAASSAFRNDNKAFPIKMDDFLDPLKTLVASASYADRYWYALQTGKWINSQGIQVDVTNPTWATIMTVTGLQDQRTSDFNNMNWTNADREQARKNAFNLASNQWKKALQDQSTNPDAARQYMTRALVYLHLGGYYDEDVKKLFMLNPDLKLDDNYWNYYIKNAPDEDKQMLESAYQRQLEMLDKRRTQQGLTK